MASEGEVAGTVPKDLTPFVLAYREAARHLWNSTFREFDDEGGGPISSDERLHDWTALRCKIVGSAVHPEIVGHEVLLDICYAEVWLVEA